MYELLYVAQCWNQKCKTFEDKEVVATTFNKKLLLANYWGCFLMVVVRHICNHYNNFSVHPLQPIND